MFEQAFKNIDDALWKDAGCDSELDYIEQTSWVLFLKYLNDLEQVKADEADLKGQTYEYILDEEFRWEKWAYPTNEDGELDHNKKLTGPDLIEFVNDDLFPYLQKFRQQHIDNLLSIEYKIGEIFSELKNKLQSGYILRSVIDEVNGSLSYLQKTNTNSVISTKPKSKIWAMPAEMVGNITRPGRSFAP